MKTRNALRTPVLAPALTLAAFLAACSSDSSGPGNGGELPATGTVQGSVTEEGAGGLAGATVSLSRTGETNRTTTSNAQGAYSFQQIPTGTWTATLTIPDGFALSGSATASVNVVANQTATVASFVLTPDGDSDFVTVEMRGLAFDPQTVQIDRGATVRWVNFDNDPHNTTSNSNVWASANLSLNGQFEHTFNDAGSFPYTCTLHTGMAGTINVQ